MNDSILVSIKKMIGIHESDTNFDDVIVMHINSALAVLHQIGVGSTSFSISGNSETWSNYIGYRDDLQEIKSYIYMKVKMMFDPPTSSVMADAMNKAITEFEWRINATVDPSPGT